MRSWAEDEGEGGAIRRKTDARDSGIPSLLAPLSGARPRVQANRDHKQSPRINNPFVCVVALRNRLILLTTRPAVRSSLGVEVQAAGGGRRDVRRMQRRRCTITVDAYDNSLPRPALAQSGHAGPSRDRRVLSLAKVYVIPFTISRGTATISSSLIRFYMYSFLHLPHRPLNK